MTLERIEPMPGELASAHEGRMSLFVGASSSLAFNRWFKQKLEQVEPEAVNQSRLTQLATICGMPSTAYARSHSLLGVLRFAALSTSLGSHGAPVGEAFTRRMGMNNQKNAAHICPQCVKEDLEHWQFSWFRRTHHLLGVDWCPSHRVPLAQVTSSQPWARLPQHWIERGDIEIDQNLVRQQEPSAFESRFSDIACALLENSGPLEMSSLTMALAEQARQKGLRVHRNGTRLLISDLVSQIGPTQWLQQYWPEVSRKNPGAFFNALDKAATQNSSPLPGFAYTTILASLWDTPTQSLEFLRHFDVSDAPLPLPKRKVFNVKGLSYWHGDIWQAYVDTQGCVIAMAAKLGQPRAYLRVKMNEIGLPGLNMAGRMARWRAYLRFEAGESLLDACTSESAKIKEVESLVRLSCARVATAARRVLASKQNAALGRPRKSPIKRSNVQTVLVNS